jgi:hypothetical protein
MKGKQPNLTLGDIKLIANDQSVIQKSICFQISRKICLITRVRMDQYKRGSADRDEGIRDKDIKTEVKYVQRHKRKYEHDKGRW